MLFSTFYRKNFFLYTIWKRLIPNFKTIGWELFKTFNKTRRENISLGPEGLEWLITIVRMGNCIQIIREHIFSIVLITIHEIKKIQKTISRNIFPIYFQWSSATFLRKLFKLTSILLNGKIFLKPIPTSFC